MRGSFVAGLALAGMASAAPLMKRENDTMTVAAGGNETVPAKMDIDPVVLNFALTLEHLEAAFYKQGLEKYSADAFQSANYPDWVRLRLSEIGEHEAVHVEFLSTALTAAGATPVQACEYSFPDESPETFLAVAQILEGVGVSAYAGAAKLITDPAYLTAAAQILAVEARHSAWVRGGAQNGDSFPQAFDVALGINPVFTLASQFITSCPESNPALPVMAFPALAATPVQDGKTTLSSANVTDFSNHFALFLTPLGQEAVAVGSDGSVEVPEGLFGQQYIILANANQTLSDDITVAGPAVLEIDLQARLFEPRA